MEELSSGHNGQSFGLITVYHFQIFLTIVHLFKYFLMELTVPVTHPGQYAYIFVIK